MKTGRSLLPVFGMWVAWVYLLSLVVLRPAGNAPPPPLRPQVRFVDAEKTYRYEVEAGANGLRGVEAEISEPFTHPVEIPVSVVPVGATADGVEPARAGVDYAADRDAVIVFPANARRGVLRERESLLDVAVTPDAAATAIRRFRLRLDGTGDVVVAADPLGFRTVDIPPGAGPGRAGIKTRFRDLLADVDERDLVDHPFVIEADRPPETDAEMALALYRRTGSSEVPVLHFTGTFPAGVREHAVRLRELVPEDALRRVGATHDPRPGVNSWYELHLDARPPLISAEDPCFTTIFCRDRDRPATVTYHYVDEAGDRIGRILPDRKFWVDAELSEPLEVDCRVTPIVDGIELEPGGRIAAGATRCERLGPYVLPAGHETESDEAVVGLAPHPVDGHEACGHCQGRPGGCDRCRKKCPECGGRRADCPACQGACPECGGRPGGCPQCRSACKACDGRDGGCPQCRGTCPSCGGRRGGCAACGFGSGVCGDCQGKCGPCKACDNAGTCGKCRGEGCGDCGGTGKCGACGGKCGPCGTCGGGGGGGGSGDAGSGRGGGGSPVSPPPTTSLAKGPPVPGDFMIFLVNNQRLHEPGDVITDRVREAIRDRRPYNQGAIVINDEGRDTLLTEKGAPPAAEKAFEPFSADRQDLEGQAARVAETIVRKRRNATNPNIRTLVVWPEREFVSAKTLEVFKPLATDGRGPVSLLCPDADPERARELAAALAAEAGPGGQGQITVRSPKSEELVEHIDDVLDVIGAPTDATPNLQEKKR